MKVLAYCEIVIKFEEKNEKKNKRAHMIFV